LFFVFLGPTQCVHVGMTERTIYNNFCARIRLSRH